MNIKLLFLFPVLLGLTYCSTTPSSDNNLDQTDISISIDQNALLLEKIRLLIEEGSLSSLREVLTLLENESVGATEQGEYYKFVTGSLLKLVFPLSDESSIRVINPKSGMLTEIVKKAGEGEIIDIPNEDVSFFTLLLSTTAALYTDSEAVIDRSLDILDTIYLPNSKSYLPVYIRSFLFEKQNLFKYAFDGYLESLEIDSHSYPSEFGVIRILIRNEEYREAISHIENVYEKYGQSYELINLFADALIGNNNLDKALVLVSEALSLNPDDMELTLKYADILQKQGEDSRALYMIKSIESSFGESLTTIRIRASILVKKEKFTDALELLEKGMSIYSDDPELRDLYGRILLLTGHDGEGRLYLEDNLELNPDSLSSLRLLTEEAILSKSWVRASEFVEKLLAKDDADINLRYAVEIYTNLDNNKKASEYNFRIINKGNPIHSDYYTAVRMLLEEEKYDSVANLADAWIKSSDNPIDKSYFYYLKSLALEDPKAKLDILRQSLFENLQNLDAIIAISDAYYKMGEKRNSYRYLKQALILVPGDEFVKEKLRKLEKEL